MSTTASETNDAAAYKAMYEEQRTKTEQLEGILATQRTIAAQSLRPDDHKPAVTAERAKALAGELQWNHKYSEADKLRAIGITAPVDKDELRKLFGRNGDSRLASELHKASQSLYLLKREAAIALNIYAN